MGYHRLDLWCRGRYPGRMAHIAFHARKLKTPAGLVAVANHNARVGVYAEDGTPLKAYITHPERTHLNELHTDPEMVRAVRTARLVAADLSRKPQKNAAAAIEIVVTAAADWFNGQPKEVWTGYLETARKTIERRFGADQIIGWSKHYDEAAPHLHVLLVPLVETEKGWAYSSSRFLGGPAGLRDFHDALARDLAPFGIERGGRAVPRGDAHTDLAGWSRKLDKRERALAVREAQMEAMWAKRKAELDAREANINAYLESIEEEKRAWAIHTGARRRIRGDGGLDR